FAGITHTTAIAHRERACAHGFELAQQRDQSIFMRGSWSWIRAVEIGFDEEVFAAEFSEAEKLNRALHAGGAIGGLDEGHVRNRRRRIQHSGFQNARSNESCSHGG